MFRADSLPPPAAHPAESRLPGMEPEAWADEPDIDSAAPLLQLCGAAALAILALAAASIVLV